MLWVGLLALLACGTDDETKEVDAAPSGDTAASSSTVPSLGHCTYINAFSQGEECKEYTGPGWTEEDAAADEQDYAEVVEYVRMGVLLLHNQFSARPSSEPLH